MKLSPLFAITFVVSMQSAMADSEQGPVAPASVDARTADNKRVELAITDLEDVDNDLCWVAPEWREVSR